MSERQQTKGKQAMSWLTEYSEGAARTDRLAGKPNHTETLAAGLFGEAGSVLAELKKEDRETQAYPAYRNRLVEELGDLLWYLVRFSTAAVSFELADLDPPHHPPEQRSDRTLKHALALGTAIGELCALQQEAGNVAVERLQAVWDALFRVADGAGISLYDAAQQNLAVTTRASYRWRARRVRSEWLPAGCSPGWPWTGDSSIFGSRHRRTCGCGSIRRLSA